MLTSTTFFCLFSCISVSSLCVLLWYAQLFSKDAKKAILVYTEAVMTVDPYKCVGKLQSLWVEFAKLYESNGEMQEARNLFKRVRVSWSLCMGACLFLLYCFTAHANST